MLDNYKNVLISGGSFVSNSCSHSQGQGIDLLQRHIAPGAFHNSSERYDPPKCHPRTRLAVIQAIMDWIEDGQKTSFIMWLYGPAGAGKSSIAQTIAEMIHQSDSRRLAASFFWSRTAPGRDNEKKLIATLAFQLILAVPEMRVHVEQALEHDPSLPSRSLEAQMQSLILEPLDKVFNSTHRVDPVFAGNSKLIILDGLDECGAPDSQRYILKVISDSVRKFSFPTIFLIASRSERVIRESFNTDPLLSLTNRLALDDTYYPDDDIRLFLVESFQSLKLSHPIRSFLPLDWPTDQQVDQLIQKSSGQFIYPATVVRFVSSPHQRPPDQLDIILGIGATGADTPFAELDALYCHIFSLVKDLPRALEILSCHILDDLIDKTIEIEEILSYRSGDVQLILIDLHSVINVTNDGGDLRVLHASLPDFLIDPTRSGKFHIHEGKCHARIAQLYLQYMRSHWESKEDDVVSLMVCTMFPNLCKHCTSALPTRELLADCFDFDFIEFVIWVLEHTEREHGQIFGEVNRLYMWFRTQEENVQKHFGSGMSLSDHHFISKEVALELVFEKILHFAREGARLDTSIRDNLESAMKYVEDFEPEKMRMKLLLDLQKYLLQVDPERAGLYYLHGGIYTVLSVQVIGFVMDNTDQHTDGDEEFPILKMDEDTDSDEEIFPIQKTDEDTTDDEETDEDTDTDVNGWNYYPTMAETLRFAVETLPFYLSNSDCTPNLERELFRLSKYLFPRNFYGITENELEELRHAIDLYLQKRPRVSGQFCQDLNPEEMQAAQTLMQLAKSSRGVW